MLADAGEARHNVNAKLANAADGFTPDNDYRDIHIDLMIGTHYDSDHLAGLVDIIDDDSVTIGEAWLPPVANDTEPKAGRSEPGNEDLLALQFVGDDGIEALRRYLAHKADICERLAEAERRGDEARNLLRDKEDGLQIDRPFKATDLRALKATSRAYFEEHIRDANRTLGRDLGSHADEPISAPWDTDSEPPTASDRYDEILDVYHDYTLQGLEGVVHSWSGLRRYRAEVEAPALALIRRSAAKDAINATSLAEVVRALNDKGVPICCRTIVDGTPRRFVWSASEKRFIPSVNLTSEGPELVLLGPSDGLVKRHANRLPIGHYVERIALAALPIESITPSNQLSYILRADFAGTRVLISGDAGCVDFKPSRRGPYHQALIDALAPLDVIQVAHHAGANAHFYRCLLAANYAAQDTTSYLLLSHAWNDKHRPSAVFARFIEEVRKDGADLQLLFTATPKEAKIRDFKSLLAPVAGASAPTGDIRMVFEAGAWVVTAHAVAAP